MILGKPCYLCCHELDLPGSLAYLEEREKFVSLLKSAFGSSLTSCTSLSHLTRLATGRPSAVTCLATDVYQTADPGVVSSVPARSHAFLEIDHEIISKVILLPSTESFKKGCCQLQAEVCAGSTG